MGNVTGTGLQGKKEIIRYAGRSWAVLLRWMREEGFPMIFPGDRWESDQLLIDEWRRDRIKKFGGQRPPDS